tara:strand:- start:5414 stop:5803 length:390 start_codon:yes stop_codon:yes gene_type:complete
MIYPVKIYDKDGKLKKVVASDVLVKRTTRDLDLIRDPRLRYGDTNKATWRVYRCRNCGVRVRSKTDRAQFCGIYCSGYWTKTVSKGLGKSFINGGLDDYPEAKVELKARIDSQTVFNKDEYKPVKRRNG